MTANKKIYILNYRNGIRDHFSDSKYVAFIESLEIEELELYLFLESKRADVFVKELTGINGQCLSISDLENEYNRKLVVSLINDSQKVDELIKFYTIFGNIESSDRTILDQVILKHNTFFKVLTELEITFFKNCYTL